MLAYACKSVIRAECLVHSVYPGRLLRYLDSSDEFRSRLRGCHSPCLCALPGLDRFTTKPPEHSLVQATGVPPTRLVLPSSRKGLSTSSGTPQGEICCCCVCPSGDDQPLVLPVASTVPSVCSNYCRTTLLITAILLRPRGKPVLLRGR